MEEIAYLTEEKYKKLLVRLDDFLNSLDKNLLIKKIPHIDMMKNHNTDIFYGSPIKLMRSDE